MPLSEGTLLGPYEILALVGAGGMGEVYKARDTRLERIVAVKVSREEFSERFAREARNVAALNHPNICTLHDVGSNYLVMEFVEGQTLSGPLPIDACLNYARQLADAIEAAHDKGIVHRDLKPANIKVTPEGAIKVLDFGLAKALDPEVPSTPGADSPTLSMAMTRAGVILGTAAYMSPEQAKGKQADRRADIWAFGVVLFEMLSGKQAFAGETAAETLASVMMAQLPLDQLPDSTPAVLRQLIGRCLERDVRRRLQAIGEARIMLENPASGTEVRQQAEAGRTRPSWIPWPAVSAVLFFALAAGAVWHFLPGPPQIITRFPVMLGDGQQFNTGTGRALVAISPDGTQMVYGANSRLYLRSMAELVARVIPGTETNQAVATPVFSPDGRSLAFYWAADRTLKRISINGGAAVTICPATAPYGMSWGENGIVFGQSETGILRVSSNGGKPEVLVRKREGEQVTGPQMLPGGEAVLFTSAAANTLPDWDQAQIVVQTLKSGARKTVVEVGSDARYLPTGHIVYAYGGTLYAVPFDLRRLEVTGGAVGLVEGVMRSGATGAAQFSFSNTGSLVYLPGPASVGGLRFSLGLVDRKGEVELLKLPPATYGSPRVSRDGKRLAYDTDEGKEARIWIYDLSGANAPRPLTLSGANRYPIWSSDGQRVAFQSDRDGDLGIFWQLADGTGTAERLTGPEKGISHIPDSWSPDGQVFSLTAGKADNTSAVWTFSLRDKKTTLFAEAPSSRLGRSVFSPDGHWLAYQVNNARGTEIYVKPFPPTSTTYQISKEGNGHHPVWSPDGNELFYVPGASQLAAVSVRTRPSFTFSSPVPAASRVGFVTHPPGSVRPYDVLPDGKRFIGKVLGGQSQEGTATPQIQVVLNWFDDVKQRVSVR